MSFGVDTFTARLDMITWTDFVAWNGGALPLFAGRNFLGGNFLWGAAEATDAMPAGAHPEDPTKLGLLVEKIAPIQGPQLDRQQLTGTMGMLCGALDAQELCKKIVGALYAGEFALPETQLVHVWLAVDPGAPLSVDYWSGWADVVNAFTYLSLPGLSRLAPLIQPFRASLLLPYHSTPTGLAPDRKVAIMVIFQAPVLYPWKNTQCWGVWADAPVSPTVAPGAAPDWSSFGSGAPPMLWRYGGGIQQADGTAINLVATAADQTKTNVSVAIDAVRDPGSGKPKATDFMLIARKWQPTAVLRQTVGISSGDPISAKQIRQLETTPLPNMYDNQKPAHAVTVSGGTVTAVGRYIYSFGRAEGELLSNGDRSIFTVWEGNSKGISPKSISYFSGTAGTDDGAAAFAFCGDVLRQPPQTPVFFTVDYPALDPPADAAEVKRAINRYIDLIAAERDKYAKKFPGRYYLIGFYAGGGVLRFCYEHGVVSGFWQAMSSGTSGSTWPDWPWYHATRWQYQGVEGGQTLPGGWKVIGGGDPDVDWGNGGLWKLTDPLAQQLEAEEDRLGAQRILSLIVSFGNLLTPAPPAPPTTPDTP